MKKLIPLLLSVALTACGGGGDSAPATGPGTTPPATVPPTSGSTGLTVTFSTSSLAFEYLEGDSAPAQTMKASVTGTTDKDVLMGAEVTGTGIETPIGVAVDTVARNATITVAAARGLAPGTYTGTIKMMACTTQACTVHHGGSPHQVNYTVTVRPGLHPSQPALTLAAAETGVTSGEITFTPPGAGIAVNATVDYANGRAGWVKTEIAGNVLRVLVDAASLVTGKYDATVTLSTSDGKQSTRIPVTLTVSGGLSVPDGAGLTVDSSSTTQQMQGNIAVAVAAGASATNWTAVSDQAWLKVPASGPATTQPTWQIDVARFAKLANNQSYKAIVTIGTNSNLAPKTWTLEVKKQLAEIRGLDTLALLAGQSGDVLVYGSGFDNVSTGAVTVDGATPTAVAKISDKVMRMTMPTMAAGNYAVSLSSRSGMSTSARLLQVTGRESYAYQAVDTQGDKKTIIVDAVTRSAYVVNIALKSVMRFAPVAGKYQLIATRSFSTVGSIGMTPDHTALVMASGDGKIYKLSPIDLSTITTFDLGAYGNSDYGNAPLTIMGDNCLMNASSGWIDLDTGKTTALVYDQYTDGFGAALWGAVSGNGMRMMRPDSGLYSPHSPLHHMELTDGKLQRYRSDIAPFFYDYSVNHQGTKWAFNNQLVDFDLNILGTFQLPDGWVGSRAVLSRNGDRLYVTGFSDGNGSESRIYAFDTSRALTTTTGLPVLGFIELTDLPSCAYSPYAQNTASCNPFGTQIAISDDDRTLFVVGDRKFVAVPVPTELRAPASVRMGSQVLKGRTMIPAK